MSSKLPQRPNLDHLRRQAKDLLASLAAGDKQAVATLCEHLPAAANLTAAKVRKMRLCLADAQSAIARKTGFANWPQLTRHVEQLRALEGTWEFDSLQVDGRPMPAPMLQTSRVLIDGDCFRSETAGTVYEGLFNIDVEMDPHAIDIEFVSGPEAGNSNHGIFALDGDRLTICLDMSGKSRPPAFTTAPGSHCALEVLRRASSTRPESVKGGTATPRSKSIVETASPAEFTYVESPTLARLQGEWSAVKVVQDGQDLPAAMCAAGRRTAKKNELKVTMAGQVMLHALVRIDELADPVRVDYCHLVGPVKGVVQLGIMKWLGAEMCSCMAPPGAPRPVDFTCPAGSGHTLSQWRLVTQ